MPDGKNPPSREVISFGPFRLDRAKRLLEKAGVPVKLGGRALDILICLTDRAGEVVSGKEVIAQVWPAVFVDYTNLRVQMVGLRKALGDGRAGTRYVTNVTGRGYCFVAPITRSPLPDETMTRSDVVGSAHNLPSRPEQMVGRDGTVGTIAAQLSDWRFTTVVGPGGIGKTTVAVAVAHNLLASFDSAVHFVDLAPLSDPILVPSAVATALGVPVRSEDPTAELISFLRDKRLLLIFDNCEHLIDSVALLLERVYWEAPGVHILATSREPLRVIGERVHRLSPLESPPVGSDLTAGDAGAFPAVQLFVARATASSHGFALEDSDAPGIAKICRRLDGIPLAIELAAAQVASFGVQGIATGLDDLFHLLTRGRRTAISRHQTLRSTLDWSYQLLAPVEQIILRRLAIFRTRFTLGSAIELATDPSIPPGDVLDAVGSLADRSLLMVDASCGTTLYRLLETTRAYAGQKLAESDEGPAIARRHATHFLALFEPAEADWERKPKAKWLETYVAPINDLRAALDWAFGPEGDVSVGVTLTAASTPLWFALSLLDEYRDRAERALEYIALSPLSGSEIEIKLAVSLSAAVFNVEGPASRMAMASARALEIAELRGDSDYQLRALWQLAGERYVQGDYRTALMFCDRYERVADATHDEAVKVVRDRMMALALHLVGRQADARHYAERAVTYPASVALSAHRTLNENDHRVASRSHLARILWVQGFPDRAAAVAAEGVEQAVSLGRPAATCYILAFAACPIAFWNGDAAAIARYMWLFETQLTDVSLGYWQTWRRCYQQIAVLGLNDGSPEFARQVEMLLKSAGGPMFFDILGTVREELAGPDAIARAEGEQCGWCAAEILRAKGVNLLRRPDSNASEEAENLFRQSLDLAGRQSALSWELRGAMSLARLWRERGDSRGAYRLLAPVYARFSEGSETVDLKVAKRLLGELASQ